MSFFTPTKEEIDKVSGKNPTFAHDAVVEFLIETTKTIEKDQGNMLVLSTKVLSSVETGREYAFFYRKWAGGSMREFVELLQALFSETELNDSWNESMLIGKKFRAICKVDGEYTNFKEFVAIDGVPADLTFDDELTALDVPF